MNHLLQQIQRAVKLGNVRISDHALSRILERHIDLLDAVNGVEHAKLLADYSTTRHEPRILVVQTEMTGRLINVVWELVASDQDAVLVTVFHPE